MSPLMYNGLSRWSFFLPKLWALVLFKSVLYLMATGAAFRCCKPLCGICTSEVLKFFYIFIEALVEMKDEYIYIPRNITELQHLSRDYNTAGLPGCVGSMDVVHVKWANC